jgi:hypothetical protein
MSVAVAQGTPMPSAAIVSPAPALRDVAAQIETLRATLAGPDFAAAPARKVPDKPANQV